MKKNFKIGLALSGGGALGFAHVGALQVLEENGIFPDMVAGTSMGAVVGGVYTYGKSGKEIERIADQFNSMIIMDINMFSMLRKGIFAGNRIANLFKKLTNDISIGETKIPFIPVAFDLLSGKDYYFHPEDKLWLGIRCSMGVPGVFKPIQYNNMLLVDGGVSNNMPSDVLKKQGADFVIGIDVMGKYKFDEKSNNLLPALINNVFGKMIERNTDATKKYADVYINMGDRPEIKGIANYDFAKKKRKLLIAFGRKCMEENIEEIKRKIKEMKNGKKA